MRSAATKDTRSGSRPVWVAAPNKRSLVEDDRVPVDDGPHTIIVVHFVEVCQESPFCSSFGSLPCIGYRLAESPDQVSNLDPVREVLGTLVQVNITMTL